MAAGKGRGDEEDIFDDVVFLEEKLHKDGYNEGYFQGQLVGEVEGFAMGVERGKSYGQEVGFYDGLVETMLVLFEDKGNARLCRVLKQMQQKIKLIRSKDIDPQNQEIFDDLEDVRSKFKQVMTMMNAKALYGQSSTESEGISF